MITEKAGLWLGVFCATVLEMCYVNEEASLCFLYVAAPDGDEGVDRQSAP